MDHGAQPCRFCGEYIDPSDAADHDCRIDGNTESCVKLSLITRAVMVLLLCGQLSCAGALWVTKEPVLETAQVVQQPDGTAAMLIAEKTTCVLIWTMAEATTPCGSSAQIAAEAFQFIGGALDFGKRFLPAGLFPKPEVEEEPAQ